MASLTGSATGPTPGSSPGSSNVREARPLRLFVFDTHPIPFAVREPLPGVDLGATERPGLGVALWLHTDDARALHDALSAGGVTIVAPPVDGPFGATFSFLDPDGYAVTVHDGR